MTDTKELITRAQRGVGQIRNARYSTGVLHVAPPAWLEDLRWCIATIDELTAALAKVQEGPRDLCRCDTSACGIHG